MVVTLHGQPAVSRGGGGRLESTSQRTARNDDGLLVGGAPTAGPLAGPPSLAYDQVQAAFGTLKHDSASVLETSRDLEA